MNIVFAASDSFALPALARVAQDWHLALVMTAPPKPAGRGHTLRPTPVAEWAQRKHIPYITPSSLKAESRAAVAPYRADLLVCVAYGRIFGPKFLALFPQGGINLHPSALPHFRGASPLVATMLSGAEHCGITVQQLALKLDSGAILAQGSIPLPNSLTIQELKERCAQRGAELLSESIAHIARGTAAPLPQNEAEAIYSLPLTKAHGQINWRHSAHFIARMIRSFSGWPRSYCSFQGQRLFIEEAQALDWQEEANLNVAKKSPLGTVMALDRERGFLVQTGMGILAIRTLQLGSRRVTDWQSFARGYPSLVGTNLLEH